MVNQLFWSFVLELQNNWLSRGPSSATHPHPSAATSFLPDLWFVFGLAENWCQLVSSLSLITVLVIAPVSAASGVLLVARAAARKAAAGRAVASVARVFLPLTTSPNGQTLDLSSLHLWRHLHSCVRTKTLPWRLFPFVGTCRQLPHVCTRAVGERLRGSGLQFPRPCWRR